MHNKKILSAHLKENKDRWNQIADWYSILINEGEFPPRKNIIDPVIKKLILELNPKTVFDAGCGEGYMSRFMAENGIKVVGGDISQRMIEIAREKEKKKPHDIEFFTTDLENISKELTSYRFELILCHQVLMNLADLDSVFSNFHNLLEDNGKIVVSITHPFPLEKESQWFNEEAINNDYTYFDTFWKVTTFFDQMGNPSPVKILTCHRPLDKYIYHLNKTGFLLKNIIEPKGNTYIPLYMVIVGVKNGLL